MCEISSPQIDLAAHVGGAASGALVAHFWGPRYVWFGRPGDDGGWSWVIWDIDLLIFTVWIVLKWFGSCLVNPDFVAAICKLWPSYEPFKKSVYLDDL